MFQSVDLRLLRLAGPGGPDGHDPAAPHRRAALTLLREERRLRRAAWLARWRSWWRGAASSAPLEGPTGAAAALAEARRAA